MKKEKIALLIILIGLFTLPLIEIVGTAGLVNQIIASIMWVGSVSLLTMFIFIIIKAGYTISIELGVVEELDESTKNRISKAVVRGLLIVLVVAILGYVGSVVKEGIEYRERHIHIVNEVMPNIEFSAEPTQFKITIPKEMPERIPEMVYNQKTERYEPFMGDILNHMLEKTKEDFVMYSNFMHTLIFGAIKIIVPIYICTLFFLLFLKRGEGLW